jgi:hypothetical protein
MSKQNRPTTAKVPNEVHNLIVHREYLAWNKRYENFSGRFRINPYTMDAIAQKPTQINPSSLGAIKYKATVYRDPIEEAFSSEYIQKSIVRETMTPAEKYRGPLTSSQEIGWYTFSNKRPGSACTKPICKETYFAQEYLKTVKKSPFKVNSRTSL